MKRQTFYLVVLILGAALLWIPRGPALPPGLTLAQNQNFPVAATSLSSTAYPLLGPADSAGAPDYSWSGDTNTGFYHFGASRIGVTWNGQVRMLFHDFTLESWNSGGYCWTAAATANASDDTCILRDGAAVIDFGNGGGSGTTAKLQASGYISKGTKFTASGCANSTTLGGGSAGSYVSVTGGTCTVTITMGDSATAPNGWVCDAHDLTTVADANNVTMGASNGTTANLVEGTVVANDVIAFKCIGY